jgi:hypothetical protein
MHTDIGQMRIPSDEAPETRERRMIGSEKLMVTIAGNPYGFHVIEVLPKGQRFNADCYCSSVITKLSKIALQFRNET